MTTTSDAPRMGLPPDILGCLFDLDGVLTDTAAIHATARAEVFDEYPRHRTARTGEPFTPFDDDDYRGLRAAPSQAAVFEDAVAGVRAGQDGEFRYVVGVDRVGHREELLASGADVVAPELTELLRGAEL